MKRLALCIGLPRLDPSSHDDWDGDCPGCDRDVDRIAQRCIRRGFDAATALVNGSASRVMVANAYQYLAAQLEPDDLLLLYYSGHGGQVRDVSGDEEDHWDETLCLWDGEVTDDTIAEYLRWAPRGARILHITDCCNGGSNYRGVPRFRRKVRGSHASLLHFGGCDDGRYSYGEEKGGHFTLALMDALSDARKPLTYREWFERTVYRMDAKFQQPVMSEMGTSFANREVLT